MENNELIPPKGAEGVGMAVMSMFEEIIEYREELNFAAECTKYYKYRKGEHWKYQNKDLNLVSANLLGSHHQKTVNMLTDNNPTFNAVPGGEIGTSGKDQLELLENVIDNWWIDTEQQNVFEESVHVGELYGTVGEHTYFDQQVNFPAGEVKTRTYDPMYISLYPPKCRKVEDAQAVLCWERTTVREARRQWPDVADKIESDMTLLEKIGDDRMDESPRQRSALVTISSVVKWVTGGKANPSKSSTDELFILSAWVKDYSQAEDGTPIYPGNIRRVRVSNAGNVVLDDEYNPSLNPEMPEELQISNYLYNRFPFSYIQPVVDPSSPLGFPDFKQLEKLNVEFNKSITQFAQFKDKSSRPKLLNPKDSGVTNLELTNSTGIANPTNSLVAQAIRFIDPPQMSNDILTGINLYKDMFNEIAGSFNDVMQGQKQGSEVIAAKAIAMLLEEASRMARGKIRNYSKMLRERGRMYIALAQHWYRTPRFVQINGADEEAIPVTRENLQIAGKINVVSGSTMPVSHIQRREEVLTLAQGGFVDQEHVLEAFNIPGARDIIKRMQAGPLGQYIQKLGLIGVPQELMQIFQQVAQLDEKDIKQAVESGEFPNFMQIIQQLSGQQPPAPPDYQMEELKIKAGKAAAEIDEIQARTEKIKAEIALTIEKTKSEADERDYIKRAGVEFDRENLTIQRARAVADIRHTSKADTVSRVKTKADLHKMREDAGAYDERGMKSNNEEI